MKFKPYIFLILLLTGIFHSCLFTEKEIAVDGVLVSSLSAEMIVGDTLDLTATVSPDNASNKTVTWSSSAPEIVTVDGEGHVTAVKEGSAEIIARAGSYSGICKVTVILPATGIYLHKKTAYKYNPREEQISIYSAEGNSWYRFLFPSSLMMYQVGPVPDKVAAGDNVEAVLETFISGEESASPLNFLLKVKYLDDKVMVLSSAEGDMFVLRY